MSLPSDTLYREIPAPEIPLPLRCDQPLPPYRYVPGLQPHPSKHELGHYNSTPPVPILEPVTQWVDQPCWLRGLDLFDHRFYWECHEQLETIWHRLPKTDLHRPFVQGLIQAAAYRLKWHMKHETSARTLKLACESRLKEAQEALGDQLWGVNIPALLTQIARVEEQQVWPTIQSS